MPTEQLDLTALARNTDPETSHLAARAVKVTPRQIEVLDALRANGGRGTIDTVMHAWPKRLRNSMNKRLSELGAAGIIRRTGRRVMGDYDTPVNEWEVVDR